MEKAMAPHCSTLAWKIPWTEEPGGLQSMGSLQIGHDWATSLSLFIFMHGRRNWQPTPEFLPGESQGRGSLVGCRLRGRTESDTTEVTAAAAPAPPPNVHLNNFYTSCSCPNVTSFWKPSLTFQSRILAADTFLNHSTFMWSLIMHCCNYL